MPVFFPEIDRMVWETATADYAFKYAQVEQAIASLHNVPLSGMKTFKGRVKHFQRIGLVPSRPGKGKKIEYNVLDAIMWALCFEFSELSVPPEQIKYIIHAYIHQLILPFEGPIKKEDDIFVLQGNFLQWHLKIEGGTLGATKPVSEVLDLVFGKAQLPRALMINLTSVKRKLGVALNIEWL